MYVYINLYIYIYTYAYIERCAHTYIYIYTYIYVSMYLCAPLCARLWAQPSPDHNAQTEPSTMVNTSFPRVVDMYLRRVSRESGKLPTRHPEIPNKRDRGGRPCEDHPTSRAWPQIAPTDACETRASSARSEIPFLTQTLTAGTKPNQ